MTVEVAATYEKNCTASILSRCEGRTPACKKKSIFLVFGVFFLITKEKEKRIFEFTLPSGIFSYDKNT